MGPPLPTYVEEKIKRQPKHCLSKGENMISHVKVTHVKSPEEFWVQTKGQEKCLQLLTKSMDSK